MVHDESRFIVKYLGQEYNLSRFRKFYPGGADTLAQFRGKDISRQMRETRHTEAAYSLLGDYTMLVKAPDIDEVSTIKGDQIKASSPPPLPLVYTCSGHSVQSEIQT